MCKNKLFIKHVIKCIIKTITAFYLKLIINFLKVFILYEMVRIGKSKEIETYYTNDFKLQKRELGRNRE